MKAAQKSPDTFVLGLRPSAMHLKETSNTQQNLKYNNNAALV
jgi:hypothetical protein